MTRLRTPLKSMLHAAALCLTGLFAQVAVASSAEDIGAVGCDPRLLGTGLASSFEQIEWSLVCEDGWASCTASQVGTAERTAGGAGWAGVEPELAPDHASPPQEAPYCFDWAAAYGLTQAELYPAQVLEEEPEYDAFVIK